MKLIALFLSACTVSITLPAAEIHTGVTRKSKTLLAELKENSSPKPSSVATAATELHKLPVAPNDGRFLRYYTAVPYYRAHSTYHFAFFGIEADLHARYELKQTFSGDPLFARVESTHYYDFNYWSREIVDPRSLLAIMER